MMMSAATNSSNALGGITHETSIKVKQEQPKLPDQPVASRTRRLSSASSQRLDLADEAPQTRTRGDANRDRDAATGEPSLKKMAEVLVKASAERSPDEAQMLVTFEYLIQGAEGYLKAKQEKKMLKQRQLEVEESLESIQAKTDILANLIKASRHVVVYTGAGISTSASIPDYRGPNGLWTQIKKTGSFSITKVIDLSKAEPTYTHMAIKELCRRRIVKHVVSQNCDGLHLRSGIDQKQLSEIHGNMYIEVCPTCERQYYRDADVTQQTSRFRHKTGRLCHTCIESKNNNLVDTIVLYGERSRSKWPMNWERASKAAENADLIVCMGSSLKTLRRYGCLWPKSSSSKKSKSCKLVIINLQHTPKDKNAALKINGKCDLVMQNLLQRLNIDVPKYDWTSDPLLQLAVPFTQDERIHLKRNSIFDLKKYNNQQNEISTSPARGMSPPGSPVTSTASSSEEADDELEATSPPRKRSTPDDENRESPSLFVSELTDDPERKRLRMRIRAVNLTGATGTGSSPDLDGIKQITNDLLDDCEQKIIRDDSSLDHTASTVRENNEIKRETPELCNTENLSHNAMKLDHPVQLEYAPPGWLGKSLGYSKSSSYRRKRHGNKGRKRSTPIVVQPTA